VASNKNRISILRSLRPLRLEHKKKADDCSSAFLTDMVSDLESQCYGKNIVRIKVLAVTIGIVETKIDITQSIINANTKCKAI